MTSKKVFKYKTDVMPHVNDSDFLKAIESAHSDAEKLNAVDNYLLFLTENFTQAEDLIAYVRGFRQTLKPGSLAFKTIIINFNGSGCPPYLDSVHEHYLISRLGKEGVAVKNMAGIGIDAKQSLFRNIIDFIVNRSMAARIQETLDYIRDNADSDCKIEILGHSRGAVQAIILARIVSQKYPQVKVIAHDPVPGKPLMPYLIKTWSTMSLNVSGFLSDAKESLRTIGSILEDSTLSIKGALFIPWRDQDKRPSFALLDEKEAYKADFVYPIKLRGFHSLGLYNKTSIDYYVYWEKIPYIGNSILNKNKEAFQGEKTIDSEREAIKTIMRSNYQNVVDICTKASFDNMEQLNAELTENNRLHDIHIDQLGLLYSDALSNPAYHAGQEPEFRKIPEALCSSSYHPIPRQFSQTHPRSVNYLLHDLVISPGRVSNKALFYLTLHWLVAALGEKTTNSLEWSACIENLQYNLLSNPSIKIKVQDIGNFLGFADLIQQIFDWKKEANPTVILNKLKNTQSQHFSDADRVLWQEVVNLITNKSTTPFQPELNPFFQRHFENTSNVNHFLQSAAKKNKHSPGYYILGALNLLQKIVQGVVMAFINTIRNMLQWIFLLAVVIDFSKPKDKNQSGNNNDHQITFSDAKLQALHTDKDETHLQKPPTDDQLNICHPSPLQTQVQVQSIELTQTNENKLR